MDQRHPPGRALPLLLSAAVVAGCLAAPGSGMSQDDAIDPLVVGEVLAPIALTTLTGTVVEVPDPTGGYVVLELIRSADW